MPTIGGNQDRNAKLYAQVLKVDNHAKREVSDKDAEFIDSVMKKWKAAPFVFSEPQAEWVGDLVERYL